MRHRPGRSGGRDRARDAGRHAPVEDAGDDVVEGELVLGDRLGDRERGRELHLGRDRPRSNVESAAEDPGECKHVVDLVRIVGAAGRDHGCDLLDLFRLHLGARVRERKHDRGVRHPRDAGGCHRAGNGNADEDVGAGEHLVCATTLACRIRQLGVFTLGLVQAGPSPVERSAFVAPDDRARTGREQDLRDGGAGRAAAGGDDPHVFDLLVDDAERVDQRGQDHDGGSVLVVVEDRDVQLAAQALFDLEAAGRRDVLEVDAAEAGGDRLHDGHDLVDVLRRETDREGVDAAELLEEHRLSLHHRQCGLRPDVAEAEHGRAVGDDRDHMLFRGQRPDLLRVVGDRLGDARDARRVRHREIVAILDRGTGDHFDLPAQVHQEGSVGDVQHLDAVDVLDRGDDVVEMCRVGAHDRDVTHLRHSFDAHDVDRAERGAGFADRGCEARERARAVVQANAHGCAE